MEWSATDGVAPTLGADAATWTVPRWLESTGSFASVSCSTRVLCTAVDASGDAFIYDGSAWTAIAVEGSSGLRSVSCATGRFCVAVDSRGSALTYNGSRWSGPVLPITAIDGPLDSLSCPSRRFCAAIDGFGHAVTFDGTHWAPPQAVARNGTTLTSISCPASTFCAAVDNSGQAVIFTGKRWSGLHVIDGRRKLESVSARRAVSAQRSMPSATPSSITAHAGASRRGSRSASRPNPCSVRRAPCASPSVVASPSSTTAAPGPRRARSTAPATSRPCLCDKHVLRSRRPERPRSHLQWHTLEQAGRNRPRWQPNVRVLPDRELLCRRRWEDRRRVHIRQTCLLYRASPRLRPKSA